MKLRISTLQEVRCADSILFGSTSSDIKTDIFFPVFLVCWGSYFDFAINWNKHLDDENVKFILYEDLKEVRL